MGRLSSRLLSSLLVTFLSINSWLLNVICVYDIMYYMAVVISSITAFVIGTDATGLITVVDILKNPKLLMCNFYWITFSPIRYLSSTVDLILVTNGGWDGRPSKYLYISSAWSLIY